ncbi:MAG TPA: hypothetical protein VK335_15250 [Bryobacteraceae bacterium]|nr:hypothetical protein [Bryobacteraceae bacterium]
MNPHLSEGQIADWAAGERDPEIDQHVRGCAVCAAELEQIGQAFSLFRESGKRWSEHWYAVAPVRGAQAGSKLALAGAVAALVVAAVLLSRAPAPSGPQEEPFVAIPYVVPPAPYERTAVVRMVIPVAALPSAGITIQMADVSGTVPADVLVGQDGRALAIRLVRDSNFNF